MTISPLAGTQEEKRNFLTDLLCAPHACETLTDMAEKGELALLLPEVNAMIGVTQPPEFHPEGDVFEHTMLMLRHMAFPDPLLAWSVLLHDVGKPLTRSVESSGRIRFFSHEEKGAEMAEKILKRFAFDRRDIDVVCHAVRNHMRFAHVMEMRRSKLMSLMEGPFFGLELELHRLDCISCHGKMACFDFLLEQLVHRDPPGPEKLVSGKDLLARGVKQGPSLGKVLAAVRDLQLSGAVRTREQALKYIDTIVEKG